MLILILTIIPIVDWIAVILVELNAFKYITFVLLTLFVLLLFYFRSIKKLIKVKVNRIGITLFSILSMLFFLIFFFHAEPFDGGRDPGCYALGAVQLVKTNILDVGQKNYLTFPCFSDYNGKVLPHPSIGFVSLLAILYKYFSFQGIYAANYIFLFLFLVVIFLFFSEIENKKKGFIFFAAFFLSHYLIMWFIKFTYNEILFSFFLWLSILLMLLFVKKKNIKYLILSFIPLSLLPLVRIEGLLYIISIPLGAVLISFKTPRFKYIMVSIVKTFPILIFALTPFVINNLFLYTSSSISGLSLLNKVLRNNLAPGIAGVTNSGPRAVAYKNTFEAFMPIFLINLSIYYQLIIPFAFFLYRFLTRKLNRHLLFILIALLPGFGFLINPLNTPDQPWFMRRFLPTIIPYIYLVLASFLINNVNKGKIKTYAIYTISFLLIGINVFYSSQIVFFSENKSLLQQLGAISKFFNSNSVAFFSDNYSQDDYMASRWAEDLQILYGVKTIINDTSKKYRYPQYISKTDDVYVISSKDQDISRYFTDNNLTYIKTFKLNIQQLKPGCEILGYLRNEVYALDVRFIEDKCQGTPPVTIKDKTFEMKIYKLNKT